SPRGQLEQAKELLEQLGVVVPGASADQVAIDDAYPVNIFAANLRHVESALRHGRQRASLQHARGGGDLDAVTDDRHRFFHVEEVTSDAEQVLVVAQVFRRPPAAEEEAG